MGDGGVLHRNFLEVRESLVVLVITPLDELLLLDDLLLSLLDGVTGGGSKLAKLEIIDLSPLVQAEMDEIGEAFIKS
jgi:hypothetical protein